MALVKCPDCEKMVSPRVQQCPFCGCPAEFFIKPDADDGSNNSTAIASNAETMAVGNSPVSEPERVPTFADDFIEDNEAAVSKSNPVSQTLPATQNTDFGKDGVVFGFESEQNPDTRKYPFDVIEDPERESDKHAKGKTHVMFRIGESKYLTVSKSDLFFAPINTEVDEKLTDALLVFITYLHDVSDLSGMTTGAKDTANKVIGLFCQYLVEKLVKYGIYEYDLKNFANECGSDILLENADSFSSILHQIDNVDNYAQDLAYQRDLERSSRSQWVGGGFGLKGAIKGAVTAGALNAATGAFRSIGDGITDAGDRSNVQSKYNAIVCDRNKRALTNDFNVCLLSAEITFFQILGRKTGWNPAGVLWDNIDEGKAKLRNLEHINDKSTREKILIEVLSGFPYMDEAIKYALSNYAEYDFNIRDLLHYVKRINIKTFKAWMSENFVDSIESIENSYKGEKRIKALVDHGVTFGVIDEECNVLDPEVGPEVIMHLISSEMADNGFSLEKMQDQTKDFSGAERYFDKLQEIGNKYHVLGNGSIKNELSLSGTFGNASLFTDLRNNVNEQLKRLCTVRGVSCSSIAEAKLLTEEWKIFDGIYSAYDSYADYDSTVMQTVIDEAKSKNFQSKHVKDLIYGKDGLVKKKESLEEHEKSEDFKKSQQIVRQILPYADSNLFVYGSKGFIEQAKKIRKMDKIQEMESNPFPVVIYDVSDSNGYKGFVVTDKYFYNYNSVLGIGFGDKALMLCDIRETAQNGKNRLFKLSNGKTEKIKIIGCEDLIIGVLSEVYVWVSDYSRVPQGQALIGVTDGTIVMETPSYTGTIPADRKPCPICGSPIGLTAKFCTFCGNKIEDSTATTEDKMPCPGCGQLIKVGAKFCTFCGTTIQSDSTKVSEPAIDTEVDTIEALNSQGNEDELDSDQTIEIVTNNEEEAPKIQVCPGCQKEIPVNAKFCTFCGYSFNQ